MLPLSADSAFKVAVPEDAIADNVTVSPLSLVVVACDENPTTPDGVTDQFIPCVEAPSGCTIALKVFEPLCAIATVSVSLKLVSVSSSTFFNIIPVTGTFIVIVAVLFTFKLFSLFCAVIVISPDCAFSVKVTVTV